MHAIFIWTMFFNLHFWVESLGEWGGGRDKISSRGFFLDLKVKWTNYFFIHKKLAIRNRGLRLEKGKVLGLGPKKQKIQKC